MQRGPIESWWLCALPALVVACSSDSSGGDGTGSGGVSPGGAGGAAGSGGSVAGAVGSGGAHDTRAIAGLSVGTIGSGQVSCSDVGDGGQGCPAGTACCELFPFGQNSCVTSLGACNCVDNHPCPVYGCDAPEDCPGQVCCAAFNPRPGFHEFAASSCKDSCAATGEVVVCSTDADCPNQRPGDCNQSSADFKRCF